MTIWRQRRKIPSSCDVLRHSSVISEAQKRLVAFPSISRARGRERIWNDCLGNWATARRQSTWHRVKQNQMSWNQMSGISRFVWQRVRDLRYRGNFDAFSVPCHIVSDADDVALMPLANASQIRVGVERVLALHRELGVRSGRRLDLDVIEMSPRMAGLVLRHELSTRPARRSMIFRGSTRL